MKEEEILKMLFRVLKCGQHCCCQADFKLDHTINKSANEFSINMSKH